MSVEIGKYNWVIFLFMCIVIVGVASATILNIPEPAPWLLSWTNLVGKFAAIIVGIRALWSGGDAAKEYAIKQRSINNR